jgi:hypothetical protein
MILPQMRGKVPLLVQDSRDFADICLDPEENRVRVNQKSSEAGKLVIFSSGRRMAANAACFD